MPADDPTSLQRRIRALEAELEAARAHAAAEPAPDHLRAATAGTVHDVNNLLLNILGNTELALRSLDAAHPARPRLRAIEDAASRARELSQQLRAIANGEAIAHEECDLVALVNEMVRLVTTSLPERILVEVEVQPAIPPLCGDATQLRQVVMNLLVNAAEAIGERAGRIVIQLARAAPDALPRDLTAGASLDDQDHVSLTVSDDGCGMTPAVKARIFEPFYSTKHCGRGLGLMSVLDTVRHHQGALRVTSEPGKGTSFQVFLPPSARRPRANSGVETAPRARSAQGAVLIAQTEDRARANLRLALEYAGLDVLLAHDGPSALKLSDRHGDTVAVAVIDRQLPGASAHQVVRALRGARPGVVVFLTGHDEERAEAVEVDGILVDGCFAKPSPIDVLVARVVARATDRHRRTG